MYNRLKQWRPYLLVDFHVGLTEQQLHHVWQKQKQVSLPQAEVNLFLFYTPHLLPLCPPWHAQYRAVFPALSSPFTPTLFSMHSLSQLKLPARQKKRVRLPLRPKTRTAVGPRVKRCTITRLGVDVAPRLAASCIGLSIDSACSATKTNQNRQLVR